MCEAGRLRALPALAALVACAPIAPPDEKDRVLADTAAILEAGAREYGLDATQRAVAIVEAQFREAGAPDVRREPVWLPRFSGTSTLNRAGADGATPIQHEILSFAAGSSGGTVPLVDVGSGEEEDFVDRDVAGAAVLVKALPTTFVVDVYLRVVRKGAVAIVMDSNTRTEEPLRQRRAVWKPDAHLETWGPIPAVSISTQDAAALRTDLASGEVFLEVGVDPAVERVETASVIARFEGTKHPDRTILVNGHIDSWFLGANDNAVSVAAMVEMARWFQRSPPAYTFELAAFAGEEVGFFGSTAYVRERKDTLREQIAYVVTLEMIAPMEPDFRMSAFDPFHNNGGKPVHDLFQSSGLGDLFDLQMRAGEMRQLLGTVPTDQGVFWNAGVPGVMVASVGFGEYHTEGDTLERVDVAHLDAVMTSMRTFITGIDALPPEQLGTPPAEHVAFDVDASLDAARIAAGVVMLAPDGPPPATTTVTVDLLNDQLEVLEERATVLEGDRFVFRFERPLPSAEPHWLRVFADAVHSAGERWIRVGGSP